MVNFTVEQIRELMDKPENIRNMTIISPMKQGKSTILDSLVARAGIIPCRATCTRFVCERGEEQLRNITVKPTSFSLYYEHNTSEKLKNDVHLINLIDSPGHIDFLSEVTTALRVVDGALVIIDCVEGVSMQSEVILRAALIEKIRPILMINNIDRQILELKIEAEEMYRNYSTVIESINTIITNYGQSDMGDILLDPSKGNIAFGSDKDSWAFTLPTFAQIYSNKFGIDIEKMKEKLWGDNYYDSKSKKWLKEPTNEEGENLQRAFCAFVMEPIIKLSRSILDGNAEQMNKILTSIGISLGPEDNELTGNRLLKRVMSQWINAADSLLEMIVLHLPSPKVAQKYRVNVLYEGPQDDEIAASIRDCNQKGPLIMYVSKMVPTSNGGRFFAFGRVFGGTISAGKKVRIMGSNYAPGKKGDLFINTIPNTILMLGRSVEEVPDVPCGNIVGLSGIDRYLVKTGTISDNESAYCIKSMKYSFAPLVKVTVMPKEPADLPRLIEGLKKLSKSDPLAMASIVDDQCIIGGCGESHIEICLNDLQLEYATCELKISDPFVTYKETVTDKSSQICLTKTANKHNRFHATAEPLSEGLADFIESGKLGPNNDSKELQRILGDQFNWEKWDAQRIWAFGPDNQGANILVNVTKGVTYLSEIKDSMVAAFQWATKEGVMTEESMRSVRMNFVDAVLMADAIHRGGGQVIPAFRRLFYAAELTAEPRMVEPIYLVEITTKNDSVSDVYKCLSERRGVVIEEELIAGTPLLKLKAYLPIAESFGIFSAQSLST